MSQVGEHPDVVQATAEQASEPLDFEDFFRGEHVRLLRALYLVTGDRQEAEELTQEAFLKVWEKWPRVSVMEDPTGYLYRTAMNAFRSRARRVRVAASKVLRPSSTREAFADVENRDVVARALASLTPRQRAALVVTELLEFDSEEAAKILGVKPETVRSLASQGRSALRDSMVRSGTEPGFVSRNLVVSPPW